MALFRKDIYWLTDNVSRRYPIFHTQFSTEESKGEDEKKKKKEIMHNKIVTQSHRADGSVVIRLEQCSSSAENSNPNPKKDLVSPQGLH